jgi:hypothetical protein
VGEVIGAASGLILLGRIVAAPVHFEPKFQS